MKKIMFLSMMFLLVLTGCEEAESISVIVPNGAPALSQIKIENEMSEQENPLYEIDTVYGADPLVSAFGSESHEIIVAPTNLGAKLFKKAEAPYQFAGTLTWGNLYLSSQEPLDTYEDLDGKSIIAFGKNATPDIVLQAVLESMEFENDPEITYVESVDGALARLSEDSDAVALVAEPALSAFELKSGSVNTLDLQEAWKSRVSDAPYPQAGVFVHTDLTNSQVNTYLDALNESASMVNEDYARVGELAETLEYPFPPSLMESIIPRSNIEFKSAEDSKDSLISYFNVIRSFNPALIGETLPETAFYYSDQS